MARYLGKDCVVTVGGNVIQSVEAVNIDRQAETFKATGFGDEASSQGVGIVDGNGSIDVIDDPADTTGQGGLVVGASVALVVMPEGNTPGAVSRTFTANISGESQPIGRDYVRKRFPFVIDGAVVEGVVA